MKPALNTWRITMRLTGIRGRKGGYKLPFISIGGWWLPPRSLRLALRVARPPRSAKRAPLWLRGLRRPPPARPAKVAGLALAAPPFQVGAWLRGGSFRFRRLRAAGVWDYIQL